MDRRPYVLIVDDDEDVRETTRMVLEDEGYATALASCGATALARLRVGPLPALILLDLQMPVMDGRALLRRMEADAELSRVPVVVITASGSTSETRALRQPILCKPFELHRLLKIVAQHVGRAYDDEAAPTLH